MCYKTSKFSREGGSKGNKNEDGKGRNKSSNKSRRDYSSDDSDNNKRKSKSRSKKDYRSDEDDKRRSKSKKEEKKVSKSSRYKHAGSSEESDDDDAVAAYYAVRIDKNKGMTVTQQNGSENGRYDSSSESTSTAPNNIKRPNIDAPAPAKGILKKVASNPSLAKLDGMSEVSGAVSEVGYITNKLTKRLQARGQRDILDPIDPLDIVKQRLESSTEDIWQQERDNWSRQKEELKAWAQSQGNENSVEQSHSKQKQQQNNSQTPEIRSSRVPEPQPIQTNDPSETSDTTFWVTPPMVPQDLTWIFDLQSTSVNTDYEPGARNPVYNYEKKEECDNDVMDLDELKNPKRKKLDILQEAMSVNDIKPEEEEVKKYQCEGCSTCYKYRSQRQRCRQRCGVK